MHKALLPPVKVNGTVYIKYTKLLKGRGRLVKRIGVHLNPSCLINFLSQTNGSEAHAHSMLMSFLSAQSMLKTRCSVLAWTWQRALPFPPISPSCSEALVGLTTSHGPCCKWLGGPSTSHVQGLCYSGMMTPQPVSWRPVSGTLCSSSGTFVFCSSFCLSLSFNLIFFSLFWIRSKSNYKSNLIIMIERESASK